MGITDELLRYAYSTFVYNDQKKRLVEIADHIDAAVDGMVEQYKSLTVDMKPMTDENMAADGWIRLPKDAYGEYIRVGDRLDGYGKTIEVVELRTGRSGWVLISRDGNGYADTFAFTHHAPTVEDVLREFAYGLGVPVADSYVAACAAKLQLADDAE